eukprot:scaffold29659_cov112-Isochrysis_galbana.AAC.8
MRKARSPRQPTTLNILEPAPRQRGRGEEEEGARVCDRDMVRGSGSGPHLLEPALLGARVGAMDNLDILPYPFG